MSAGRWVAAPRVVRYVVLVHAQTYIQPFAEPSTALFLLRRRLRVRQAYRQWVLRPVRVDGAPTPTLAHVIHLLAPARVDHPATPAHGGSPPARTPAHSGHRRAPLLIRANRRRALTPVHADQRSAPTSVHVGQRSAPTSVGAHRWQAPMPAHADPPPVSKRVHASLPQVSMPADAGYRVVPRQAHAGGRVEPLSDRGDHLKPPTFEVRPAPHPPGAVPTRPAPQSAYRLALPPESHWEAQPSAGPW